MSATPVCDDDQFPRSRFLRGKLARRIAGLVCFCFIAAAAWVVVDFARFVSTLEDHEHRPAGSADGIVVLTGGADRIADAVDLLAEGRGKRLLITGVNPATSKTAISATAPRTSDLLACCIDLDRNALNTVGNALEAARWVREKHFHSIIVVTSSYHMPRSLMELRRVLPDTDLIAYPVVPLGSQLGRWWQDPGTLRLLIYEYAKYTGALLRLRLERPTARKVRLAQAGTAAPDEP
ncbi:YdcF family protein [Labrys wisconsinensis]|uniref:Uncharacterized SAM-binding protein YcdF (DUF218 family) n=1 Tax=Labrys wisconsinensis TaxID=425677 RepID=A0ABU0JLJ6_9HYPH|nr:YdcF family protein [Labrys wisconsinensis]MDQ0475152.1 uncharacterized SAM-binding protein YcdF (DUF218 family) [Labrys wisconsinensis]